MKNFDILSQLLPLYRTYIQRPRKISRKLAVSVFTLRIKSRRLETIDILCSLFIISHSSLMTAEEEGSLQTLRYLTFTYRGKARSGISLVVLY
jgi:hypothetical protein